MASLVTKLQAPETYTERVDALRAQGNVLYGELAAGGGGDTAGKRSKLQRAEELYTEALGLSCNSQKRASCCKNLGALHYLWGKVELELMPSWDEPAGSGQGGRRVQSSEQPPPSKLSGCTEHLGQAMRFLVRAHVEGARAQKPDEWMQQVTTSLAGLVTWAAEQSRALALPGAPILKYVCEELENLGRNKLAFKAEAEALANLELVECLFDGEGDSSSSPPESDGQDMVVEACEAALNRARHLLYSLPASAKTEILSQWLSRLQCRLSNHPVVHCATQ